MLLGSVFDTSYTLALRFQGVQVGDPLREVQLRGRELGVRHNRRYCLSMGWDGTGRERAGEEEIGAGFERISREVDCSTGRRAALTVP